MGLFALVMIVLPSSVLQVRDMYLAMTAYRITPAIAASMDACFSHMINTIHHVQIPCFMTEVLYYSWDAYN